MRGAPITFRSLVTALGAILVLLVVLGVSALAFGFLVRVVAELFLAGWRYAG